MSWRELRRRWREERKRHYPTEKRITEKEEAKKQKESDDLASLQTVDWNDFVVVETITFDEDMGVGVARVCEA